MRALPLAILIGGAIAAGVIAAWADLAENRLEAALGSCYLESAQALHDAGDAIRRISPRP